MKFLNSGEEDFIQQVKKCRIRGLMAYKELDRGVVQPNAGGSKFGKRVFLKHIQRKRPFDHVDKKEIAKTMKQINEFLVSMELSDMTHHTALI